MPLLAAALAPAASLEVCAPALSFGLFFSPNRFTLHQVWRGTCMFLSRQLSASGNVVEAAALLAAIGEAEQAVLLLLQHGACREACLLAQHSAAVSPQVRCDSWAAMAAMLQAEGKHAAAAEAFACAGDIGASIECLERVGTLKSLLLVGNLVVVSQTIQPYKTSSLLAATMQQRQVLVAMFACVVLGEDSAALANGVDDDGKTTSANLVGCN